MNDFDILPYMLSYSTAHGHKNEGKLVFLGQFLMATIRARQELNIQLLTHLHFHSHQPNGKAQLQMQFS